jgi:flagellar motor switch protein FliM
MMTVRCSLVGLEDSYTLIQVATPGEIVALITFEVSLGSKNSGLISFCLPYPVLEGVMGQLSAQHIFHRQTTANHPVEERDKILGKLSFAKIPVQVLLGGTAVRVGDLMGLAVGDVIRLDRFATDPLLTCVNGKPKFYCRAGKLRDNLAVSVTEIVAETEAIEGFGLDERGCHE